MNVKLEQGRSEYSDGGVIVIRLARAVHTPGGRPDTLWLLIDGGALPEVVASALGLFGTIEVRETAHRALTEEDGKEHEEKLRALAATVDMMVAAVGGLKKRTSNNRAGTVPPRRGWSASGAVLLAIACSLLVVFTAELIRNNHYPPTAVGLQGEASTVTDEQLEKITDAVVTAIEEIESITITDEQLEVIADAVVGAIGKRDSNAGVEPVESPQDAERGEQREEESLDSTSVSIDEETERGGGGALEDRKEYPDGEEALPSDAPAAAPGR